MPLIAYNYILSKGKVFTFLLGALLITLKVLVFSQLDFKF